MSNTPQFIDNNSNPQWSDGPTTPFPNACFGACYGQTTASASPVRLINGLTISNFVTVYTPSTNTKIVYIGDKNVTSSNGFPMEAGKGPIVLDTRLSAGTWWVISADGSNQTIAFLSNVSDPGSY